MPTTTIVGILIAIIGITQAKTQQVTVELIESNFEAGNPEALQKAIELENLMQKLGSGDCLGTLRRRELSKIGGECRQMAASQTITGKVVEGLGTIYVIETTHEWRHPLLDLPTTY